MQFCASWLEHVAKMEKKLSQHYIASYTAKRHQLGVGGVCKVFACLFGSWRVSFETELLIAALSLEMKRWNI